MTTSFKFRTYGDAVSPFDFLEIENHTKQMQDASEIIEAYKAKEKSIYDGKLTEEFSFSEKFLAAAKAADDATKKELLAAGWERGKDFIQTPFARLEWEYLGSKIFDPNNSDSDVTVYEIRIIK